MKTKRKVRLAFSDNFYIIPKVTIDNLGRPELHLHFLDKEGDSTPFLTGRWDYGSNGGRTWKIPGTNKGRHDDLYYTLFYWGEWFDFEKLEENEKQIVRSVCFFFEKSISDVMKEIRDTCKEETRKLREENQSLKEIFNSRKRRKLNQTKYVYLLRHKNGLTKIGFSTNPKTRERTLQSEDPEIEIIGTFIANRDVEKKLHNIFSDVRVRGEWFKLEERHIDWILALKPSSIRKDKQKTVI